MAMTDTNQALAMLQAEMRSGFTMLAEGISQTNVRLERVELRLERVEGRLDKVESRLDKVESRLDKVESRLDQSIADMREFRVEVNTKLNGISSLILSSERNTGRLEKRIVRLEGRVDRLEGKDKPAQA